MKGYSLRIIKTAALALAGLALLGSCRFSAQPGSVGRNGNTVTVNLAAMRDQSANAVVSGSGQQSARTVVPASDPEISRYELWGAKDGTEQAKIADITDIGTAAFDFEAGTWNFTLKAFNAGGEEFLSGISYGVTLESDPVTVSFILSPLVSGNGTVGVTVDWSGSGITVSSVEVSFDGAVVTPAPTISANKVSFDKSGVPAGTRLLTFKLKNSTGTVVCSVSEMVRVYPGMTSSKTIALGSSDFNTVPLPPSGITVTRIPSKSSSCYVLVTWTDASNNEEGFGVWKKLGSTETLLGVAPGGSVSYPATLIRGVPYTFEVASSNSFGMSTKVLSALYTAPLLCTVSYADYNTLTGISSVFTTATVEQGDTVVALPTDPKKTGYVFGGWWTETSGTGDQFTASTPVSSTMTVYAKWNLPTGSGGIGVSIPESATVELTAPASVSYGTAISASATCSQTADSWSWYIDGVLVAGQTTSSFTGGSSLGKGPHTLMAVALFEGNAYSDSQSVLVQ